MQIPAARVFFPEEDRKALVKQIDGILSSGQLTLGKYGREFEQKFAQYIGTEYAVAINSGTSALEIILRALDIKGHSVVVPTNTFFATPLAALHAGGEVIFADAEDNLCLDPVSLEKSIRSDTKAVIVVHIGGLVTPKMNEIIEICRQYNLHLIEDAAHAHGSTLDGKKAGSFGIAAAFSFYPTKVITSGEGGMITTSEESLYQRATVFRDQGKAGFYGNVHTELGYNWRMSEIHAAIGLSQFLRLDEFIADRRKIARVYDRGLAKIGGLKPVPMPPTTKTNYYKYVAILDKDVDRSSLKKEMKEKYSVGLSGEVYELPCHLQPVLKNLYGYKDGEFPMAEDICRRHICLPVFARMTEDEAKYVADCLMKVMKS